VEQVGEEHGVTTLALSDGLEQHSFCLSISLKGLVAVPSQYRYRGTLGQLGIELDAAAYNFPRRNYHAGILPPVEAMESLRAFQRPSL
jgi:hypothetical protein